MAGIVFPDLAGSVLPALQAQQAQTRNAFEMDRMRRADEADAREQAVAKDIPAALAGDKDALGRVAAVPKYALAIAPMIERMDAHHQALLKSGAEWQTRAALGVLNAPPEQKVEAHRMALAEGRQLGFGNFLADMPAEYTPGVDAKWQFHASKAEPVAEYFKRQGSQLVPPPGSGGAPGAPAGPPAPGGGPDLSRAGDAIAGLESGGKYDAVGPDTGNGNRALGKFQVMASNVGPWTAEVFGKPMTPQEFLANPQAQDALFKAKFGQLVAKHGIEKAPLAWFAGEAGMNNPNARDVLGTSVADYGAKFAKAYGGGAPQANGPPVQLAGGPQPATMPNGMPRTPSGTVIDTSIPPPPFMPQGGDQPTGNQPGVMPVPQTYAELNAHPMARELKSLLPPGYVIPVERGTGKIRLQDGILTVLDPQGRPVQVQVPKQVDPKDRQPPTGYAPSPGGGLAPIPGGPEDLEVIKAKSEVRKTASEKAIPQTVVKGMQENLDALKQIDRAVAALQATPNSVGGVGSTLAANIPGVGNLQNRDLFGMGDPGGAKLRALIADIGSLKIHDRSGAAVTASEFPRLRPFIPSISDDPATVRTKLENFKAVYAQTLQDTATYYNADNGFKAHKPTEDYLGGGTPEAAAPAAPGGPPKPGTVDGGYLFNGGDPGKPENWRKVQ